jgi:hypothetical protein
MTKEMVIEFAKRMATDITIDPDKKDWQKHKDKWWFFSQLAKEVNAMEFIMAGRIKGDASEKAASIANLAMIVSNMAKKEEEASKKKKKSTRKK